MPVEKPAKRKELTTDDVELIRKKILEALKSYDLKEWQKVCKSLVPFNYDRTTRKKWFEENKFRVKTAHKYLILLIDGQKTSAE